VSGLPHQEQTAGLRRSDARAAIEVHRGLYNRRRALPVAAARFKQSEQALPAPV
jgi:hypothetical protein